ncbi:hypothetical protein [Natronocalculus amylovorans]|uniref:Uncharacterized protein n=1 Tax=Natronocalculus amylovorans TaxID=2917812 RepID=A0AAE3FWR5_9EURY|nr:hypothetical protein [Natronocalculus amylovorans]MCL9816661.1 hypothetical protein [Natronocalculus amylovorans]NUE01104.1 hypothetical protein [Halorubraceae archaeon YAN]
MSRSDSHTHTLGVDLRLVPTDTVTESDRVTHIDQLSEQAQETIFSRVCCGSQRTQQLLTETEELHRGDILVFTDYFELR